MTWLLELLRAIGAILALLVGATWLAWVTRPTTPEVWPGASMAREQWEARWRAAS